MFTENAVFTGKTGDAVKSYLGEAHITILSGIKVTAQTLLCLLYTSVLASAVSAYTYGKNKNLDVKNGLIMIEYSVRDFVLCGCSCLLYTSGEKCAELQETCILDCCYCCGFKYCSWGMFPDKSEFIPLSLIHI